MIIGMIIVNTMEGYESTLKISRLVETKDFPSTLFFTITGHLVLTRDTSTSTGTDFAFKYNFSLFISFIKEVSTTGPFSRFNDSSLSIYLPAVEASLTVVYITAAKVNTW